jgi:protoheme IX farnesyltransferase
VNPLSAALALGNIALYTLAYTPLKKQHWLNTWVGAIVGAIPPLIGWAGNTGSLELGAWLLAYLLFIWQIPHFLSLSWPLESDYRRAGYRMLINSDPDKVRRLTLRYALYLLPVTPIAVYCQLCSPLFALTGSILTAWLIWRTIPFYRSATSADARRAFMATIYYLPLLILLLLLHKAAGFALEHDDDDAA